MKCSMVHLFRCKYLVLLLLNLLWLARASSQLTPGRQCPDVAFTTLTGESGRLSHYDGKALILLFWSTHCSNYRPILVKVDSLQRQYGEKVQVLLVSQDPAARVKKFLHQNSALQKTVLPVIPNDTALRRLFPAEGYPYTVWIDQHRVVRYITAAYNTTGLHLEQFLRGDDLALRYIAIPTQQVPLWQTADSIVSEKMQYFSMLTPCLDGRDVGAPVGETIRQGRSVQITCNCCSMLELIKKAFGEGDKNPVSTRYGFQITDVDSSLLVMPADPNQFDSWQSGNTFNYTAVLPKEKKEALYGYMQQDLLRMLPVSVKVVKKKVRGYALVPVAGKQLQSKGGQAYDSYQEPGSDTAKVLRFIHQPTERIFDLVKNWLFYFYPIENRLPAHRNVDLIIEKPALSGDKIDQLRKALQISGIDLKPMLVEINVVVVSQQ